MFPWVTVELVRRFLWVGGFYPFFLGKHRCHPGGRGNAGGMHQHRILFDKLYVFSSPEALSRPGCVFL